MLSVTPAHALQTEAGEWVAAGQLEKGTPLRSIKGIVRLDSTYTEAVSPTPVISYELEGGLDYVVGEMPVVVAATCDLKTIKEALGAEFSIFQNRIISLGLKSSERAELYKDFIAGNQQLRNLLKTEEGLKAWKGLANTTASVRTNVAWLNRTKTWLSEGATLSHSNGRTILQKAGTEVAEIKNGQLLPTKYESAGTAVGDVTDGYQVVKNGNNWGVKRVPDTAPYSPSELTELTQHPQAHVLERHGADVTDDALIKRANQGIAPDGSKLGNQNNPIRPFSSKFDTPDKLKQALNNTKPGSPAFANKVPNNYPNSYDVFYELPANIVGNLGKGVPSYGSSFQPLRKVKASYAEVSPGNFQLITMFPIP